MAGWRLKWRLYSKGLLTKAYLALELRPSPNPFRNFLALDAEEIDRSFIPFDRAYYIGQTADALDYPGGPLAHYLEIGTAQGLDPQRNFSTLWYAWKNQTEIETGQNPWFHYLTEGQKSGLPSHPGADSPIDKSDGDKSLIAGGSPKLENWQNKWDAAQDAKPHLIIIDQSLCGYVGHSYEYDASIAKAATDIGYRTSILANGTQPDALPGDFDLIATFRRDMWSESGVADPWSEDDIRICNEHFLADMVQALDGEVLDSETVIFAHMITSRQIMALVWFARRYLANSHAKMVLLLRYELAAYRGELAKAAFEQLEQMSRDLNIELVSDSDLLAAHYKSLTNQEIRVVPIPHTPSQPKTVRGQSADSPFHFVALGNARRDKGILDILEAIRIFARSDIAKEARFTVQCNDAEPDLLDAINAFEAANLPQVTLRRQVLTPQEYADLLHQADGALIPYWSSVYEARTSGVFVEAICADKVVICSKDTWMAAQATDNAAAVLCDEQNPESLALAIRECVENAEKLKAEAIIKGEAYRAFHNRDTMLKHIIPAS
jgi:glycosyltransferase involved in cell wall biosynthesis